MQPGPMRVMLLHHEDRPVRRVCAIACPIDGRFSRAREIALGAVGPDRGVAKRRRGGSHAGGLWLGCLSIGTARVGQGCRVAPPDMIRTAIAPRPMWR